MLRRGAIFLLLFVPAAHAAAQTPAPAAIDTDLPAFIHRLDELSRRLDGASAEQGAGVLRELPSHFDVRSSSGRFEVPMQPLARRLSPSGDPAEWANRRRDAVRHVLALRAEAQSLLEAGESGAPTGARERLRAILAAREFARHRTPRWLAEWRRRIVEWIDDMLSRLGVTAAASRNLALVLAWLATVAAVGGVALWLYRDLRTRPRGLDLGGRVSPVLTVSARDWALKAIAAARAGDTRQAVRFAYRAALQRVEEQGGWRVDEARTPREYVRLLRPGDERDGVFTRIARQFEQVLYGRRTVTPEEMNHLAADLERLGCVRPAERAI